MSAKFPAKGTRQQTNGKRCALPAAFCRLKPPYIILGLLVLCVFSVIWFKRASGSTPNRVEPSTYGELINLSDELLAHVDMAKANLLCALGLPGAENLNVDECLATLDQWAALVRANEQKYRQQFHRNPGRYDNSISVYRAVNLALTLKQDLGCDYNMELVESGAMADLRSTRFFRDSSDLFLHGFMEKRKGSCASLPVLMVAVGRRCGYPLYLVTAKGHLFCRWDSGDERFNLETAITGVDSKPDSHYMKWPHPIAPGELETEKFLKNLTPREELGIFAQIRGDCLRENQRFAEAKDSYRVALRAFPESNLIKSILNNIQRSQ